MHVVKYHSVCCKCKNITKGSNDRKLILKKIHEMCLRGETVKIILILLVWHVSDGNILSSKMGINEMDIYIYSDIYQMDVIQK